MSIKKDTIGILSILLIVWGCNQLKITPQTIHFAPDENLKTIEITHKGNTDAKVAITITPSKPWLEITPNEGILGKNDQITVQVYLNRFYSTANKAYPDFATAEINIKSFFETHSVIVTTAPNYFTQIFDNDIDFAYKSLSFIPDESINFYKLKVSDITNFPAKLEETKPIIFSLLQNVFTLKLEEDKKVLFYGNSYDTLYISCFGWIEFVNTALNSSSTSGKKGITDLERHFYSPRISLFPINNINNTGSISYTQLQNRIVITYENVPTYQNEYGEVKNTFQIEFFYTGKINIYYLNIDTKASGVIGLSYGTGEYKAPPDFVASDLVP